MKKKRKKPEEPLVLSFAYGDLAKLTSYPWPWKDNSVSEITLSDVFQYVKAKERETFMNELYRVLKPDGKATLVVAYYSTAFACADFRVEWPLLSEHSFLYFNREWREKNRIPYRGEANFGFSYGYIWSPEAAGRNAETQAFQVKYYLNTVQRLQVAMTAEK